MMVKEFTLTHERNKEIQSVTGLEDEESERGGGGSYATEVGTVSLITEGIPPVPEMSST